jgi:hypothetical protein
MIVALAASCFVASSARAIEPEVSPRVCNDAHAQAETLRETYKLLSARGQLEMCARTECSWFVREDCARWLKEVEARIPSVVLAAKDAAGLDRVDVDVTMDGVPLVTELDARPVDVDPGVHVFVFDSAFGRAERKVTVTEGAKAQQVAVTLGAAVVTAPRAQRVASPPAASVRNPRVDGSEVPWVHPGWYLPVGIDAGVAFLRGSAGAILGVEASVVHIDRRNAWLGAYAEAAYLTNEGATRFSIGPEVGFLILGLDGGFLDVVDHGNSLVGFTLRPMLTFGVLAVYGRWDHTFSNGGEDGGQIGILVKVPVPLSGGNVIMGIP